MNLNNLFDKINSKDLAQNIKKAAELANDLYAKLPAEEREKLKSPLIMANKQMKILKDKGIQSDELDQVNDMLIKCCSEINDKKK